MSAPRIIPLQEIKEGERHSVGSKAEGLARLIRSGFAVPPGFCITTAAYRNHLDAHGLGARLERCLEMAAGAQGGERRRRLRELRELIATAPFAEGLRADIERHLEGLGTEMAAVRSSAVAEDLPGFSFAGQYDSFLGVSNLADCLEAVGKCWASLWTERAFEYRERNGFTQRDIEMAVIVQCMIEAEAAGVVFGADPMTGSRQHIIVEAVPGMGGKLVSGEANPDRFMVSRASFEIASRVIAGNGPGTGQGEDGNNPARVSAKAPADGGPCIDEATAKCLAGLAARAENYLGAPQDMEWARASGRIYMLQSRPITAFPARGSWEERQVWSNLNTGEVMPDVVTPASWTLVELLVSKIFRSIFGRMGLEFGDNPIISQVAGRAYFNLNTVAAALRCFPGTRKMNLAEVLGGEQGSLNGDAGGLMDIVIPDEDLPDLDFSPWKLPFRAPFFLAWFYSNSPHKSEEFIAGLRKGNLEAGKIDSASSGDGELMATIGRLTGGLTDSDAIIGMAARGMYYFMTLDTICGRWFGDPAVSANRLCCGLEHMDSAEAGLELWRLALKSRRHPEVERAVLASQDFEALRSKISGSEGGTGFLDAWDRFMVEHGHHTRGELELCNARWCEDPDYVLGLLRGYLHGMDRVDPLARFAENEELRISLTRRCRRFLKNPLKRRLFDYYLRQAQRGLLIRENVKSEAVRSVSIIRRILLELGRRSVARGILEDESDIFFLSLDEVGAALEEVSVPELRWLVGERRREYERNLDVTPPKVIYGTFNAAEYVGEPVDTGARVLTGLAVSPGVVTGRARVILRSDGGEVLPGEIMVAPFTDPGWTPHFLTAAAIVMDMGGLLSHGSIVAREYGIPTVVNVGPATRIIRTGQRIQVDGDRGIVRILG